MSLITRPSDIKSPTWSVTAGANAALYPLANLSDRLAHTVAKSTGTTITYRATFGGAQALEAIAFINTDATAIQVTNGAGLSEAVVIPSTPGDGLHLDPWIDLRDLANVSSTTWDFALTGPSGVAMGEILLIETLRALEILWSPTPSDREQHPTIVQRTDRGVKWKYGFGERARGLRGTVRGESVRADLLALERDARGGLRNFLLIPDDDTNDALFVDLATDVREFLYTAPGYNGGFVHDLALDFEEQQKGIL